MNRWIFILILAVGGVLAFRYVQLKHATPTAQVPATPTPAPKKQWTPDDIAKDPQGYLVWSDQQVQAQIAEHQKKLDALAARRQDVVTRQQALNDDIASVQNIHDRLQTAYDRANDEDRWPVRMAGRTFERAKAQAILAQTQSWVSDRQPLSDEYAQALKKMDDSAGVLKDDIASLGQLREKLALDLEKVRLNQGMEELDQLRKNETQLASMSQSLSKMSDDQVATLPRADQTTRVDIDSLLK